MISLTPSKEFKLPIVAERITPDVFQSKKPQEIGELKVWEGNRQELLGNLFKIDEVAGEEASIVINGDVTRVRRLGAGMTMGEITVNGNVGMHLGEEMKGGKIIVNGNVEGWVGSMMKGGEIEIHGNAGDYLGAPYRGSTEGVKGGRIMVHGSVGNEAGAHMKKGMIKIYGSAGQFAGFRMHGGTVYVRGDCQGRAGACMLEGKIVVGGVLESVLPTFLIDSVKPKVKIEEGESVEGPLYVFLGDLAENGTGKLYVLKDKNPHLKSCEQFL